MHRLTSLVLAAGLAATMSHAEPAMDYMLAFARHYPGGTADPGAAAAQGLELVPRLEGRWTPGHILFEDGFFDAQRFETSCRMLTYDIVPAGRFGFSMRRVTRGEPTGAVVTYSFAGGFTFSRTPDLEGQVDLLFPNMDLQTLPPGVLLSALTNPDQHGLAQVTLTGKDALSIVGAGRPAAIYLRCPE